METCARISLSAGAIHLLLRTDGGGSAQWAAGPASALVEAFAGQPRVRELRLEAPKGRLALALAPRLPPSPGAAEQQVMPTRRRRVLDPAAVCEAADGSGVAASCATACPAACSAPLLALSLIKLAAA